MRSESVTIIFDSNQISINGFSSKELFALFMYIYVSFFPYISYLRSIIYMIIHSLFSYKKKKYIFKVIAYRCCVIWELTNLQRHFKKITSKQSLLETNGNFRIISKQNHQEFKNIIVFIVQNSNNSMLSLYWQFKCKYLNNVPKYKPNNCMK